MSVEVLITNRNLGPVIELCVESVLRRTDHPGVSIVVHDDSTEARDREYLERAEACGWLRLVRSTTRERYEAERATFAAWAHPWPYWHGCALNVLINETCRADYAMVLDGDVYANRPDWLSQMMSLMDERTLVVSHEWAPKWGPPSPLLLGWCRPHFLLLNMAAYHDGMEVDWRGGSSTIDKEPYRTLIESGEIDPSHNPEGNDHVCFDPGSSLWAKLRVDNPKQYKSVDIPPSFNKLYTHWNQGSMRALFPSEVQTLSRELAALRRMA